MDQQSLTEKSYWTKRRKVLSNVDCFLRSHSTDSSLMEMSDNCATSVCAVKTDCSSVIDSFITTTEIPATSCSTHSSSIQRAEHDEICANSETLLSDASDCLSQDSDTLADEYKLCGELAKWYASFGISLDALGALLKILHEYHPILPVDARTLLKTPDTSNLNIRQISGGEYYHFGVANGIQNVFQQGHVRCNQEQKEISLQINIDGLPLFKSTKYQLWPILGMVMDLPVKHVFTIGLYGGNHKPSDISQYLHDFVKECQYLEVNGINLDCDVWAFKIHSIVCDAPARSFVRNTKGHNAYGGCDRCRQVGLWLNKVIFPDTIAEKRTNFSFRNKVDEDYHTGESPVLSLSIDIVQQLPLEYASCMPRCCASISHDVVKRSTNL